MHEQRCWRVACVGVFALIFAAVIVAGTVVGVAPAAASAMAQGVDDSVDDTTAESVPDDTEPEVTEPDDTEPDDQLVGAGDPDGEIDAAYTAIAIIGFVALVLLASWWMVRRNDPDAGPMPPDPDDRPPAGELI